MALSTHITDLITAYKEMPNGERRNKVISHLKDAEAHGRLLEFEDDRFSSQAEEQSLLASHSHSAQRHDAQTMPQDIAGLFPVCICKPGVRNNRCTATQHVA